MGRLVLCNPKKADRPYYVKSLNIRLYTIEELCYYLYHNLYLLDEQIISGELLTWISKELGLSELGSSLEQHMGDTGACVLLILKHTGYMSDEDIEETRRQLSAIAGQSEEEKRLSRAGHLLKNQKYTEAVLEYGKLDENQEPAVRESILHNLGTAYTGMFLFGLAAECYYKAWQLGQSPDTYRQLLYTLALAPRDEAEMLKEKYGLKDSCQDALKEAVQSFEKEENKRLSRFLEVLACREDNQISKYYEGLEDILDEWKREYRNFTG